MKYNIDPELKKYSKLSFPFSRFIFPIAAFVLNVIPKGIDKKKVDIDKFNVAGVKGFVLTPKVLINVKSGVLIYLHGGGFAFKANPSQFKKMEQYALESNRRIIFIDYSLSPKYIFPHALNECLKVYKHFIETKDGQYFDMKNIFIGGDSAGASLGNDIYLSLVESKYPILPKGLMLIYPVVDKEISSKQYIDTPVWDSKKNMKMWEYYLKGKQYISPLKRIDLYQNDISVYIETCEFDCLKDEGKQLYEALKDKVEYIVLNETKGTYHGYDMASGALVTKKAMEKRISFLNIKSKGKKPLLKKHYGSDYSLVKKNNHSNNICDTHIDGA